MTRIGWWCVLVFISIGVIALDILTGPHIQFPIAFVIPVGLGAWYLGSRPGVGFGLVLVGCRFGIAVTLEGGFQPVWAAALNAGIRTLVLVGMAVLVAKAQQKLRLEERVRALEGILQICAFCKKIRRPDGVWQQLEAYISERSAAQFSHGFCEACGREHYAQYFPTPDTPGAEPGAAPDRPGKSAES